VPPSPRSPPSCRSTSSSSFPAALIRRYEHHPRLKGFVKGATAAAAGAIAGAAIVIAGQVIDNAWSVVIGLVALVLPPATEGQGP
jgi:hypothetical protein